MNKYIPLYLAKKHLNIDDEFKGDDEYLVYLISVVQSVVENEIDDKLSRLEDDNGDIPDPLLHAMLLLLGLYYMDREPITHGVVHEVPNSFHYLTDLFRNYNPKHLRPK